MVAILASPKRSVGRINIRSRDRSAAHHCVSCSVANAMSQEPKYYVHTQHIWGERRTYTVADRTTWRTTFVSKDFFKEKQARALCDRMNADWEKYITAKA
jgi:hypothetical protein